MKPIDRTNRYKNRRRSNFANKFLLFRSVWTMLDENPSWIKSRHNIKSHTPSSVKIISRLDYWQIVRLAYFFFFSFPFARLWRLIGNILKRKKKKKKIAKEFNPLLRLSFRRDRSRRAPKVSVNYLSANWNVQQTKPGHSPSCTEERSPVHKRRVYIRIFQCLS